MTALIIALYFLVAIAFTWWLLPHAWKEDSRHPQEARWLALLNALSIAVIWPLAGATALIDLGLQHRLERGSHD